jgi:hypothetical protein
MYKVGSISDRIKSVKIAGFDANHTRFANWVPQKRQWLVAIIDGVRYSGS